MLLLGDHELNVVGTTSTDQLHRVGMHPSLSVVLLHDIDAL